MNPLNFDRISTRFAERRLSRRQVPGDTPITTASVQDATPESVPAEPWDGEKTTYLFVQSFHSGSIMPTEGQDGRYTVTLEQGSGQTVYFGDRPSRDVGATATPLFLQSLGFPEDNPPNAALIVETSPGETDVAVVELFNPTYDLDAERVTYDVEVLENWQNDLELGFREEPADLATLAPSFGAAHLLIDDCPDGCTEQQVQGIFDCPTDAWVTCHYYDYEGSKWHEVGHFEGIDTCINYGFWCMPCEPYGHEQPDKCETKYYWGSKCNASFPDCNGKCTMDVSTYKLPGDPCGPNPCC